MEAYNNNYVEVFPSPLILTQSNNSNYLESKLNLRNLTNEYILFKIFNNQRSLYSAKPSTSYIPPMETTSVKIKRFKKEEIISQQNNDKFLVIFYIVDKVISNNEEAKESFKSQIYKEDSKQETVVSIIIKEDINDNNIGQECTYNEYDLMNIGNDYIKGIKIYTDLNENLRKESNKINDNIKELEKLIEMIKVKNQLKIDKDNALKQNKKSNKYKGEGFKNILLISILLLGLLFGANLANGYNRMSKKKNSIKIDEIIINKSDNFTNMNFSKIDEKNINDIKNNNSKIDNNINIEDKNDTINFKNDSTKEQIINNGKNETIKESKKIEENDIKKEKENKKEKDIKKEKEKTKEKEKNKDFLSFSFLIGSYLCLLMFLF